MAEQRILTSLELSSILRRAKTSRTLANVRPTGSEKVLCGLRIEAFEEDAFVLLSGANDREAIPQKGEIVMLAFRLDDEVFSLLAPARTRADGIVGKTTEWQDLPLGWPQPLAVVYRRWELTLSNPASSPIPATLRLPGGNHRVQLLNLTERVMVLNLIGPAELDLHSQVSIDVSLPGHPIVQVTGLVHEFNSIIGPPLSTRICVILQCPSDRDCEIIRQFSQVRQLAHENGS